MIFPCTYDRDMKCALDPLNTYMHRYIPRSLISQEHPKRKASLDTSNSYPYSTYKTPISVSKISQKMSEVHFYFTNEYTQIFINNFAVEFPSTSEIVLRGPVFSVCTILIYLYSPLENFTGLKHRMLRWHPFLINPSEKVARWITWALFIKPRKRIHK